MADKGKGDKGGKEQKKKPLTTHSAKQSAASARLKRVFTTWTASRRWLMVGGSDGRARRVVTVARPSSTPRRHHKSRG